MSGLIAIVGRPNVGKSALFNRIAGRRIAIVHDQPGVTRDRVSAELEWEGRPYTLVDTGGIGLGRGEKSSDAILKAAVDQVDLAIESADAIVLVVNVREGLVPLDREVAARLRDSGKPVLVAVNKADHAGMEGGSVEFAPLGFDRVLPVSAIHGIGITELMEAALKHLPAWSPPDHTLPSASDSSTPLKLAIVGRPNVGKSSLVNALTRSERVIVNPTPGTTRDSVDVRFEVETDGVRQRYLLIDTAGMRKQRRIDDSIEFFSVKRSEDSIARCDLAILVLDAESGILEQDKKIAGKIVEERKACIIVVNKWDLVADSVTEARKEEIQRRRTKDPKRHQKGGRLSTLGEFGEWVQGQLFFLDYAPVIFTSALSGFHLDRLLEAVRYVAAQTRQRIPTALLNRTLNDAIEKRQPVSAQGHRLKFFYATQTGEAPPAFVLFVNRDELLSDQYQKYLAGELRRAFGFEGCPLVLRARPRPQSVKPIRKFDRAKPGPRPGRSHGSTRDKTRGRSGARTSSSRRKRR